MNRLRRAAMCALVSWLLPGAALVAYRRVVLLPSGECRWARR